MSADAPGFDRWGWERIFWIAEAVAVGFEDDLTGFDLDVLLAVDCAPDSSSDMSSPPGSLTTRLTLFFFFPDDLEDDLCGGSGMTRMCTGCRIVWLEKDLGDWRL